MSVFEAEEIGQDPCWAKVDFLLSDFSPLRGPFSVEEAEFETSFEEERVPVEEARAQE